MGKSVEGVGVRDNEEGRAISEAVVCHLNNVIFSFSGCLLMSVFFFLFNLSSFIIILLSLGFPTFIRAYLS